MITKFTKVNNFGYGVTLISPKELRTEHAPKYALGVLCKKLSM